MENKVKMVELEGKYLLIDSNNKIIRVLSSKEGEVIKY